MAMQEDWATLRIGTMQLGEEATPVHYAIVHRLALTAQEPAVLEQFEQLVLSACLAIHLEEIDNELPWRARANHLRWQTHSDEHISRYRLLRAQKHTLSYHWASKTQCTPHRSLS